MINLQRGGILAIFLAVLFSMGACSLFDKRSDLASNQWLLDFTCTPFAKLVAITKAKEYSETYTVEIISDSKVNSKTASKVIPLLMVIQWQDEGIEAIGMNNLGAKIYFAKVSYSQGMVQQETMPLYRNIPFLPVLQGLVVSSLDANIPACFSDKTEGGLWFEQIEASTGNYTYSLPDLGYNVRAQRLQ